MLISFSVGNFRSFDDEQTLDMVASNKLDDHPEHLVPIPNTSKSVLRTAVFYGANAAGKSNFVRAMLLAQKTIIDPSSSPPAEPFKFQHDASTKPSSFEFRFMIGSRVFVYGFDILRKKIITEWFCVKKGEADAIVYERDQEGDTTVGPKVKDLFPEDKTVVAVLTALAELKLRSDQLMLNRIISLPESVQGQVLGSIVHWFTEELLILKADYRSTDLLDRLADDPTLSSFATEFLNSVGTGIGGLRLVEAEREGTEFELRSLSKNFKFPGIDRDIRLKSDDSSKVIERRLFAQHPGKDGPGELPFSEESDGTQQLIHLMPVLKFPSSMAKVIVIDELDRSLHPLLCWEFIRFFSETCPGERKQLIVTTHEAHLLNQNLLRRDEYWFVEKDIHQKSKLVSLSDFKVRNDLAIEKGYLQGRFSGVPVIGSMEHLEELLNCSANSENECSTNLEKSCAP